MALIKPGYKTSEFWFTMVSFLFSGLYLLGVIGDIQHKDELISNVSHAVESCILIGGQTLVLYNYIKGRNHIKETWWSSASEEDKKELKEFYYRKKKKKKPTNATKKTSTRKNIAPNKPSESDG
jgi:hypothetical protein